jgi:hypothetical protein
MIPDGIKQQHFFKNVKNFKSEVLIPSQQLQGNGKQPVNDLLRCQK